MDHSNYDSGSRDGLSHSHKHSVCLPSSSASRLCGILLLTYKATPPPAEVYLCLQCEPYPGSETIEYGKLLFNHVSVTAATAEFIGRDTQ